MENFKKTNFKNSRKFFKKTNFKNFRKFFKNKMKSFWEIFQKKLKNFQKCVFCPFLHFFWQIFLVKASYYFFEEISSWRPSNQPNRVRTLLKKHFHIITAVVALKLAIFSAILKNCRFWWFWANFLSKIQCTCLGKISNFKARVNTPNESGGPLTY